MSEIHFHPEARIELIEAVVHVESDRTGYGQRVAEEVDALVEQIVEFPSSGTPLSGFPEELDVRAYHLATFRYSLIVANVEGERTVYAFAHQHRRPGYWKSRVE